MFTICLYIAFTCAGLYFGNANAHKFACDTSKQPVLWFSYTTARGAFDSSGGIPAVDLALEQINNSSEILPNYTLCYDSVKDSRVS